MQKRMILWLALLLMGVLSANAQQQELKGKVTDSRGEPLIGVSVVEKGSTNGCITDFDGNFAFKTAQGKTVVFSYIGYESQELKVTNQTHVTITLKEDATALNYTMDKRNLFWPIPNSAITANNKAPLAQNYGYDGYDGSIPMFDNWENAVADEQTTN